MNDIFESAPRRFARLIDAGSGRRAIHWLIFLLFAATMAVLHAHGTFQGLKSPRAMEEAQLARSIANHEGLATRTLRPLSLWYLASTNSPAAPALAPAPLAPVAHPDLLHPPLWPATLSLVFRAANLLSPHPANGIVNPADYWPLATSHFFAVLSILWVWLIARRLFDARTGTLSAVTFLLCGAVWGRSAAADDYSLALFLLLGAVHFALVAVDPRRADGTSWPTGTPVPLHRWLPALALSALLSALAILTRYAAAAALPCVPLYIALARHRPRSWARALLHVLLTLLFLLPWILRNLETCGAPFGLAPLMALSGTYLFPGDALPRALSPTLPDTATALYALQLKTLANLRAQAAGAAGFATAGPILALALCACLHPFRRPSSRLLRWALLPAAATALVASAVFGDAPSTAALLLLPLAIPYGWAFFLILLDRLRTPSRLLAGFAAAAVLLATSWTYLLALVPPRTGHPYPPYYHAYIDWACDRLPSGGTLATDIPWATAWYGNVPSLLLPQTTADFSEIDRTRFRLPLVYLTTETRDRPWHTALSAPEAPDRSWYLLMSDGRVPSDFPLQHARYIGGTDQLLLSSLPLD